MVISNDERHTASLYSELLKAHGSSFRSLNWGSEEGQRLRFEVLSGVGKLQGARVLDVGCGLGHFACWMEACGIEVEYTGVDLSAKLLEQAARDNPGLRFIEGSILDSQTVLDEEFDYVFASGLFYSYRESGEEAIKRTVTRMWELARVGVAFNTLSGWTEDKSENEFYADPLKTVAFCQSLSPWLVFRHDYHPRDFTVYLTREARCA
ncbi:hypothetical protein BOW53_02170 [Solemya pervernicosa gill symbiont]|uniref:Methyltransferase domain-containing protein n=1 Tax=Solemya pervernicosa gill symbiont TaxID=642797 RepID=A0A1T2L9N3_9GAMM|nr:class I SAM-dependent methyltransferase [Solemya pervernicosa gill symbiont]OOZ41828.1 hypothetical protein BOW53_02170 [Solemya pervernicosa gill symbiont]